ncbi:trypsin-like serine protease [Actinotalea sp. Marseille-Q4924]|uniref:S1 family peptidase n=1 Tax=Actinotalea sp. Marseille-Q4924 TaxID=2866571 RepID=UPI001CE461B4|nr:trypsin-like serine protease [Actinotalea sp. Marseille-Q4924]
MRFTRAAVALTAALGLAAVSASPAAAIRYGEPDNEEHPYVGIMVADDADGTPMWRCSGTLISPTIFLTAGHCTFDAANVTIWFDEDVNDREASGYPLGGETSVEGTPYTHPAYDDAAFYLNDLGVVVLDEPVYMDSYGVIPEEGYFDDFFVKRGQNKQLFTAVGYGLQRSMPAGAGLTERSLERRQATLKIINQDAAFGEKKAGNSVLFTNNAATGGTCSGDSGGPIFVEGSNVVAAVTSYGLNAICAGTGGGYRVDTADDLAWLATFGIFPGENWETPEG